MMPNNTPQWSAGYPQSAGLDMRPKPRLVYSPYSAKKQQAVLDMSIKGKMVKPSQVKEVKIPKDFIGVL